MKYFTLPYTYVLSLFRTIFLNNKLLTLTNDTVPEIYPNVLNDTKGMGLRLQSGDIGFWVVPNLQVNNKAHFSIVLFMYRVSRKSI